MPSTTFSSHQEQESGVGSFVGGVFIPDGVDPIELLEDLPLPPLPIEPDRDEWGPNVQEIELPIELPIELIVGNHPVRNDEVNVEDIERQQFWNWYNNHQNSARRGGITGEISVDKIRDEEVFISDLRRLRMEWNSIREALVDLWRNEAELEDFCLENQISSESCAGI